MAMVTVGASAFILPVRQPLHGPALCTRRASTTTARFAVSQDELKKQVGYKSVDDYVTSGMVVGLGTGSTAAFAGMCVRRAWVVGTVECREVIRQGSSDQTSYPSPSPY